jgi:hypothetical protein
MSLEQCLDRVDHLRERVEELEEQADSAHAPAHAGDEDVQPNGENVLAAARLKLGETSARAVVLLSRAIQQTQEDEDDIDGNNGEDNKNGYGSLSEEELEALLRGVAVAASQWLADELARRDYTGEEWTASDGWEVGDDREAVQGRLGYLSTMAAEELDIEVIGLERARTAAPGQVLPRLADARGELAEASMRAYSWKEEEVEWLRKHADKESDPAFEEELQAAAGDMHWFALLAEATVAQALSEQLASHSWVPRHANAEGLGDLLARQQAIEGRAMEYHLHQQIRLRHLESGVSQCEEADKESLQDALDVQADRAGRASWIAARCLARRTQRREDDPEAAMDGESEGDLRSDENEVLLTGCLWKLQEDLWPLQRLVASAHEEAEREPTTPQRFALEALPAMRKELTCAQEEIGAVPSFLVCHLIPALFFPLFLYFVAAELMPECKYFTLRCVHLHYGGYA